MTEHDTQGGIPMSDMLMCLRCGGVMEEGFVPDQGHYGALTPPSDWVEGEPQKSIWTGIKTKGKRRYKVANFRCENCGHLEWFASIPADE